ncbi:MAG: hypothetical protein GXP27_22430 [Planctomycetes bacterium]|nr:hypothetical protein [Planctomycetota bacterium]
MCDEKQRLDKEIADLMRRIREKKATGATTVPELRQLRHALSRREAFGRSEEQESETTSGEATIGEGQPGEASKGRYLPKHSTQPGLYPNKALEEFEPAITKKSDEHQALLKSDAEGTLLKQAVMLSTQDSPKPPGPAAEERQRVTSLLVKALGVDTNNHGRGVPSVPWPFTADGLVTWLFPLSGSEIEAKEVSMALLLLKASTKSVFQGIGTASQSKVWLCPHPSPVDGKELRRMFGEPEGPSEDIAWPERCVELSTHFSGGTFLPICVLGILEENQAGKQQKLELCDIMVPQSNTTTHSSPSEIYEALARELSSKAELRWATIVWLKPARAIRVYHGQEGLTAHFLRLRKTQAMACRSAKELRTLVIGELTERGLMEPGDVNETWFQEMYRRLVLAAVELSEMRSGGAVYLSPPEWFSSDVQKEKDDPSRFISHCDQPCTTGSRPPDIAEMALPVLIQYLRQDGATLITPKGQILAWNTYFNSCGGRRSTARYLCCNDGGNGPRTPLVGIVVSQDGEIFMTTRERFHNWGVPVYRRRAI